MCQHLIVTIRNKNQALLFIINKFLLYTNIIINAFSKIEFLSMGLSLYIGTYTYNDEFQWEKFLKFEKDITPKFCAVSICLAFDLCIYVQAGGGGFTPQISH